MNTVTLTTLSFQPKIDIQEPISNYMFNKGIFAAITSCFYFMTFCISLIGITVGSSIFSWIHHNKSMLIFAFIILTGYVFYKIYKKNDLIILLWFVFIISLIISSVTYFTMIYWHINSIYLLIPNV